MPAVPKPEDSDYAKAGMGKSNLFVLYSTFTSVMMSVGVVAAVVPLFAMKSERNRARVAELAVRGFGPAYLSWFFYKACTVIIGANLGMARRDSGVNVPDQHVYKVAGGSADGAIVLMDDDGVNGKFNRAQRAVGNLTEQISGVIPGFLLNMQVFPQAAAGLFAVFSAARVVGAIGYTKDRKERMTGNMMAGLCANMQDGMVLVSGFYATYLQFKA